MGGEWLHRVHLVNRKSPLSTVYVQNLFSWSGSQITGEKNYSSGSLLRPARETDYIIEAYNSQGRPLGLEGGDEVCLSGVFDGKHLTTPATNFIIKDEWGEKPQPIKELLHRIQNRLDETMAGYFTVTLNQDDPNYPKGAFVVVPSEINLFSFSGFKVSANNSNNNSIAPSAFNQTMEFTYSYKDEE